MRKVPVAISRIFGGVTLAFTVLAIAARNLEDVSARRAIDAGSATAYLLIALASLWNVWEFTANGAELVSWTSIVVYAALATTFGYLFFGPDMRSTISGARPMA